MFNGGDDQVRRRIGVRGPGRQYSTGHHQRIRFCAAAGEEHLVGVYGQGVREAGARLRQERPGPPAR